MSSTPLLEESGGRERREGWYWRRFFILDAEEAKAQVLFSVPMILTNVSYYSITLVSVMFAGHLGEAELAGATLGNSWGTVTGLALMTGLSGALETLCGQAYGAKMYKMLGIYLQSSMVISIFFSALLSVLWCYSEPLLIWLHQDPQVSKLAALYLKHLIPGLFSFGLLQCVLRFLQTQTVVIPLVICSVIPLVLHIGLTYALVHGFGLGFKGSSLSASISLWISFLILALYVCYSSKFRDTWEGLSMEAFRLVIPNMKLALPSALMVCLEYWAFELLVLLAGLMPNSERSTSLIAMCVNTEDVAYMITYGFSAAVSTRVSNEIGARNTEKAKNAAAVSLKLSAFLAFAVVLLLAIGHNFWASLFSSSPTIMRDFACMTPLLTMSILLDSGLAVLTGVCRGCGWQHLAAWTNLATFYLVGMQLALLFGFKFKLRVKGLWIGLLCGLLCQACTLLVITLQREWKKLDLSAKDKQRLDLG